MLSKARDHTAFVVGKVRPFRRGRRPQLRRKGAELPPRALPPERASGEALTLTRRKDFAPFNDLKAAKCFSEDLTISFPDSASLFLIICAARALVRQMFRSR